MEMAIVLFVALFVFLFLSAPIYVALTAASLITMFFFGDYSLSAVMQRIFGGMDKFALMSLPFYVIAADIMTVGGMSKKIVDFVNVAMGSFCGSLAVVTQGASMFFGALSGSSPATVVAIGSMMYPRLTSESEGGYSKKFAAGLIASSGAVAILIPPSITFIIYGATTGVSIAALFAGGLGAGLVFGVLIMTYSYYICFESSCSSRESSKRIATAQSGKGCLLVPRRACDHCRWNIGWCVHSYRSCWLFGRIRALCLCLYLQRTATFKAAVSAQNFRGYNRSADDTSRHSLSFRLGPDSFVFSANTCQHNDRDDNIKIYDALYRQHNVPCCRNVC